MAICLYRMELGTPVTRLFVSLSIVRWQGATSANGTPAEGMASLAAEFQDARDLDGVGDQAFSILTSSEAKVYARKDDLMILVAVDLEYEEAPAAAARLAQLATDRWGDPRNPVIAVPVEAEKPAGETEEPAVPLWSNACELFAEGDVRGALPEAEVSSVDAMGGTIRLDGGKELSLPEPVGCWYTMRRRGEGTSVITNQVQRTLENVLGTDRQAAEYFDLSARVAGDSERVAGVGSEAATGSQNNIVVRQGRVVFHLRVSGGETDVKLHDEATEAARQLAIVVASKLKRWLVPAS